MKEPDGTDMIVVLGARSGTSVFFRCLERTGFHADASWYRRRDNDSEHRQFRTMNIRLRKSPHLSAVMPEAQGLWHDILDRGVEIIKEPLFTWVWPAWLEAMPDFRDYKYVWMKRDVGDQAHSLLKYQARQGYKDRSLHKCYRYCEAMDRSIHELISRVPNHLTVDFHDFVNLRKIEQISQFIGRHLDTSLVDTEQVSLYPVGSAATQRAGE